MWDALNTTSSRVEEKVEAFISKASTEAEDEDKYKDAIADSGDFNFNTFGAGSKGSRGKGERNNKMPVSDLKGKDWMCPSCSNTNWSWRSNCNMCNTSKPVLLVSDVYCIININCGISLVIAYMYMYMCVCIRIHACHTPYSGCAIEVHKCSHIGILCMRLYTLDMRMYMMYECIL
ncbi:hypothetical protein EON65_56370 [archaeon]|nr:MAG: hypothetical protein EON65_56370 [archaeon]